MKASGICGDAEADNWLYPSTEVSDIACFISHSLLTSVTGKLDVVEADAAFACPAAPICLGIGSSPDHGHGCSCHHTAILSSTEDKLISRTTTQTMQTAPPASI